MARSRNTITPDGVTALDRCRTLLADYEEFLTSFSHGEPAGILRLGVAPAAGNEMLVRALSQVRRRFPKMVVQVCVLRLER
jgi:DNA-binding transcriptional LysR family regulator